MLTGTQSSTKKRNQTGSESVFILKSKKGGVGREVFFLKHIKISNIKCKIIGNIIPIQNKEVSGKLSSKILILT